ncbi:hypothetical protein E1211_15295 [Micromonospora sp. 15K316]|uniref:hypothetical protein n=1 Tax=Micromonospora sp. 15K316 TaxID=2530376 RepID=UPI001042E054|nr:hypothetical protein [Micromonospora sp. 15K316]TDC35669.1 hypothetical protein E1211_15295 [Micromonospora sp. 15K316]
MTGLLIATHDQAVHAIREHLNRPDTNQLLRGVVFRVLDIHHAELPEQGCRPWTDCGTCFGQGRFECTDDGVNTHTHHCHCQCPWCVGCEESLCRGACPTVAAIAERLDLTS